MKLIFRSKATLIPIILASGGCQIHECTQRNHCCPPITVWCGFTINGWKTVTVNVQRYLTLLSEKVVPCLHEKSALSFVTFIQDGATSHTANPAKE
ncbi:UNVERIFIED_CONTAM: hypothetical protein NCL1_43948 [Trichonephila clavipes]